MKRAAYLFCACAILLFSCKKNEPAIVSPDQNLIANARTFFDGQINKKQGSVQADAAGDHKNPRTNAKRNVLWNKAYTVQLPLCKAVVAPVSYDHPFYIHSSVGGNRIYGSDQSSKLIVYSDSNQSYHAELVSFFPDSSYANGGQFTGIVFVDDWQCNPISKFKFEKSGALLQWKPDGASAQGPTVIANAVQTNTIITVYTCITINGYNYSPSDPSEVYYWTESGGCTYKTYVVADQSFSSGLSGAGGGGYGTLAGGGGGISPAKSFTVVSGNSSIINIADYDKCFTNIAGSGNTYKVSVCVSQPNPGSRSPWGISVQGASALANPINVGHTFLILTQSSGSSTTQRNIGFYPKNSVTPISPSDAGQLNNDQAHSYNISLTITVTNSQFFRLLGYISSNAGDAYNLNSYNCTNFTLNALATAGVNLPNTKGQWLNGGGNDPGDLGEDIRSMPLSSNMSRNTTSTSHPNIGTCN